MVVLPTAHLVASSTSSRVGSVRDPRLVETKLISEKFPGIAAAFESSERRLLIVGEPGSGKTMAAYSLIAYLDEREGYERTPLLVNLSAWEAQENFERFQPLDREQKRARTSFSTRCQLLGNWVNKGPEDELLATRSPL